MMNMKTFFLLLFLLLPLMAFAAGEPQPLIQPDLADDAQSPPAMQSPAVPAPPPGVVPATPVVVSAPHREAVVEKNELAAPVLTSYGNLDEKNGGLAMDIWKGIAYSEATAALERAAQKMENGEGHLVLAELLRRAALTKVYEPEGAAEGANPFFRVRIHAAIAAGDLEGALALLQKRPDAMREEDWQGLILAAILHGNVEKACALRDTHPPSDSSGFAQKLGIICELKANPDTARLHLDMLREAGDADALFLELGEKTLNPKAKITQKADSPNSLPAFSMALMVFGKIKATPDMAAVFSKTPQRLFTALDAPVGMRVKIMEHFARQRQLTRSDIETLFSSIALAPKTIQELRAAPEQILTLNEKEMPAALRRVAALRAIAEEDSLTQKAHILATVLSSFSNADILGALGDSLLIDAQSLLPLPENAGAAPAMLRLLLLRDGKDLAAWWRLASAAPQNRDALLPLFPLALYRGLIADEDRASWFEAFGRSQSLSAERKNLSLALIKALGVMLPSDEESQLAAQNFLPALGAGDTAMPQLLLLCGADDRDSVLRAIASLKAIKQDKMAETLALLKL